MEINNYRILTVITFFFKSWWDAFSHYFYYQGRTNRAGFWCFAVLNSFILYLLFYMDEYFRLFYRVSVYYYYYEFHLLFSIYLLLTIIPSLLLFVRRFHDLNLAGYWVLLLIIPIPYFRLNFFIRLLFLVIASLPGTEDNAYGKKPVRSITV